LDMYIRLWAPSGDEHRVAVSKRTLITDLRKIVTAKMGIPNKRQRLLFMGKELHDSCSLFEYTVNINSIIQVSM